MPRDNICVHMAHVFFNARCNDCVQNVGMFVTHRALLKILDFSSLGVSCLCRSCDGCCVFRLNCDRVWEV